MEEDSGVQNVKLYVCNAKVIALSLINNFLYSRVEVKAGPSRRGDDQGKQAAGCHGQEVALQAPVARVPGNRKTTS